MKTVALAALALALLAGVLVISNTAWRKRQQQRAILEDRIGDYVSKVRSDRFVDIGVELRCVVADPDGEEFIPNAPKMRLISVTRAGGILDTRSKPPRIVAPSQRPRVWYCSEDQLPIILHADELPLGLVVYGSEGAGKTEILPKWHYFRWLENLGTGLEAGQTAPTRRRLKMFRDAFFRDWPRSWFRWRKSLDLLELADTCTIQLVQTKQQSKDSGSPIQGYNWGRGCGSDEFQDSFDKADDIEARGRSAPGGRYKQLRPCTAKDSTAWREFRDKLLAARDPSGKPLWEMRKMLGRRSPFVPSSFWDAKKAVLSKREYHRRVEPLSDLPPELAVFYGWDRERNLILRPDAVIDVTPAILSDYQSYQRRGARSVLLVAHDPGNIWNTSVVLRIVMLGDIPTWVVVGEKQTKQTTARQHAVELRDYLRETFHVETVDPDCDKVTVFIDPHGRGDGETDYQTHYMAFQKFGFDVFNPAGLTGMIKRRSRIDMVNRLLCPEDSRVRLVVAKDKAGHTLAPVLVDAFESLVKRPGEDDPEGLRRKDEDDKTHAPAALGYGLWMFEQEAMTLETQRRARAAAGRRA